MPSAVSADPPLPLTVTLPEAVATLDAIGLDGAAEEALRSRESEVTASSPSRAVEALCTAYGKIDRGHRRMQLSLQASPSYLESAPNAATRWAWDCAYPAPYASAVRAAEIKETLPEGLLDAVMRQESAFDERAVSPARAIGVLQLLPETGATVAKEMGIQLDDPRELHGAFRSIALGARYLHDLLIRTHGSIPLAVAAYNAGSDSVLRWASRMHAMEIDAFVESIPFGETRNYVVRVMESFARYAYLAHGEAGVPKIELTLP
jgi:soluble lytic murein transglycosylase